MAIDWNDNTKRKALREALQDVYPSSAALELFVDEELNENLAAIAEGGNLQSIAYGLMKWAQSQDRLDELYEAFKGQNSKHPVIKKLEQQSFVCLKPNLSQDDWDCLFGLFLADDLADLKRAFERGFQRAFSLTFQQAQPKHPALINLSQIRELLETYDRGDKGLVFAVRFVECAIAELRRSSESNDRDLTALEQWRDRISQQHNVSLQAAEPKPTARHAYLLVVLEELGADVNVYPELHIAGSENPIRFGATPATCSVDQVADQISKWIRLAEDALDDGCDEEEVILEVFLPCRHLEENIAVTWKVKDRRDNDVELGIHRRFLVRSAERIRDRQIQKALMRKWQQLDVCVQQSNACSQFHLQESCPEQRGSLCALLKDSDATGLKFAAKLPTDPGKRIDLFNDIIDSAVPIALWATEMTEDVDRLKAEFDALLSQCDLTDFADLARRWRRQRIGSELAKHIRLLCDRPDRLPNLPDPDREEDLLVAV